MKHLSAVQMFSDTGAFIARWGTRGRLPGQLQRPTGLAITREGLVAVSDYENKCVSLFNLDGKYRNRIGAGKLLGPKGLAVTQLLTTKGLQLLYFRLTEK